MVWWLWRVLWLQTMHWFVRQQIPGNQSVPDLQCKADPSLNWGPFSEICLFPQNSATLVHGLCLILQLSCGQLCMLYEWREELLTPDNWPKTLMGLICFLHSVYTVIPLYTYFLESEKKKKSLQVCFQYILFFNCLMWLELNHIPVCTHGRSIWNCLLICTAFRVMATDGVV